MTASFHSGRLTSTDASFLYLERDTAPMHIGAVCLFDGPVAYLDYVSTIDAKLDRLPRFREKVVSTPLLVGQPTWETDRDFEVTNHVLHHQLARPGSDEQLHDLIDELIAEPLSRERPLWELHLIDGLADGTSAIVSKVHHAMVDGVGGNQILTTILDLGPNSAPRVSTKEYVPTRRASATTRLLDALWDNARTTVDSFADYQRAAVEMGRSAGADRMRSSLKVLRQTLPEMTRPPRRLPFNRRCGGDKKLVWTRFSFAEARAVRAALGGTVNDVVLACLAGAVGRYCEHHGVETRSRSMRVMVPVNVRADSRAGDLGNQVSVLPVDLPLGISNPRHRIGAIRESTRALKKARVADRINMLSHLLGTVPVPVQAAFGAVAISPFPIFNMVCTNVPGPQIPLYALGARLREYYPYVPTGYDMGVACAIFSYNQNLCIGLSSDTAACPDVELLRDALDSSIAEIKEAAGVGDIEPLEIGKPAGAPAAAPAARKSASHSDASEART